MTDIENSNDLYLYVLVNLEYDSMGRGRCAAQSAHAANQFIDTYIIKPLIDGEKPDKVVMMWRNQANGFGTQIVKAVENKNQLEMIVDDAKRNGFKADIVVDPEYVIQDGVSFHIIPNVITAAYIFCNKDELRSMLWSFPLLNNDPVDRKSQFTIK